MTLRDRSSFPRLFLILFFILVVGYGAFEARRYVLGPELSITSPQDGSLLHGQMVEVQGVARNISFISLNGRQIYVNEEGAFTETFLPPPGYTVVTVAVRDRFGRSAEESVSLLVE